MPRITLIQLDASGDGRWGLDNIEYGQTAAAAVPEPASATLALLGGLLVGGARLRRVRSRRADPNGLSH